MNGIQINKAQNTEKLFPGCLGRMVNFFDLSTGVAGNRLLSDKPHCDGSSLSRSRSEVARIMSPTIGDQIEDKLILSDLRRTSSNKRASGTPMKTLIDQEMSKEVDSRHNPPNLVAKLMGLESLPGQQPHSTAQRSHSRGYSRRSLSHSGISLDYCEQDHFLDKQIQCKVDQCQERNEYRDVYEIWQQSQQKIFVRDSSALKGRNNENVSEKKMALVRQKFMEAKRLATDERLRQSKEFQDALEVLSSNKDLFLRFLQEPNSLFSQRLYDLQSIPPSPEAKRITVLRPSKMVDSETFTVSGKKMNNWTKKSAQVGQSTEWDKNTSESSPTVMNQKASEHPSQPTRIVVLKPSPGKTQDIKAVASPPLSSPRTLHGEDLYNKETEVDESGVSREVPKEITRQMHENMMGHRRDETLLSSVFSNGYIGDESSFNKSENEYATGNLSDSEVMSPTSRHSWDYINRFDSPYSSSSFSRASCSPESSVCREAKKRLSERWAMMALNGSSQEQRHIRRSSSTLGEMLALSDIKKVGSEEGGTSKDQEPRGSTSCLTGNFTKEGLDSSPKNLLRSKSVPVSATANGARLNVEVSDSEVRKLKGPKELIKAKSMTSSLKGKVSSLFFSKNKKASKEKYSSSPKDVSSGATAVAPNTPVHPSEKISDSKSQLVKDGSFEECVSPCLPAPSSVPSSPDLTSMGHKHGIISQKGGLSVAKPLMPGHTNDNQDQPSPISVLEPPFEEDDSSIAVSSGNINADHSVSEALLKSNLIDKSPPIESIARTLSWDDSCVETASPYPSKPSLASSETEEEPDWLFFVQTLLSNAGISGEVRCDAIYARWHSLESPLDPSLRDKYPTLNDKELPFHEAKRRQRRSNWKIVFDCVNAALVEIAGYGSDRSTRSLSWSRASDKLVEGAPPATLVDHVWARMKEWFSSEVRCVWGDGGDSTSLVVERVVRKEVVGKGWAEQMRLELDTLRKDIEEKLLLELVEETVVDLTGGT